MNFHFVRVLRTPSSERYLLQRAGADFAALDLHYLPTGKVNGTLILFDQADLPEENISQILSQIDELLLPEVSVGEGNLTFTVVTGRILGAYTPNAEVPGTGRKASQ